MCAYSLSCPREGTVHLVMPFGVILVCVDCAALYARLSR